MHEGTGTAADLCETLAFAHSGCWLDLETQTGSTEGSAGALGSVFIKDQTDVGTQRPVSVSGRPCSVHRHTALHAFPLGVPTTSFFILLVRVKYPSCACERFPFAVLRTFLDTRPSPGELTPAFAEFLAEVDSPLARPCDKVAGGPGPVWMVVGWGSGR